MARSGEQIITVHVTPRSGRDEVSGIRPDAEGNPVVQVRVKAAPEGGKANAGLCAAVAKSLGVPKGGVSVLRGATSRTKLVSIAASPDAVRQWMDSLPAL